jgi:hypothetical protein
MMQKTNNTLSLFLGLLLAFSACNRTLYAPNDLQITPLNTTKDTRIGAQAQVVGEGRGIGMQAALVIKPHLAVKAQMNMVTGSGDLPINFTSSLPQEPIKARAIGMNAEGAMGLHKQVHPRIWLAAFVGGGVNRVSYRFNGVAKSALNYGRGFVQPEIVITGKYADFGFGHRLSYVNYFSGRILVDMPQPSLGEFLRLTNDPQHITNEMQIMIGGGNDRYYIRNSFTYLVSKPPQSTFSRMQFSTSVLFRL